MATSTNKPVLNFLYVAKDMFSQSQEFPQLAVRECFTGLSFRYARAVASGVAHSIEPRAER